MLQRRLTAAARLRLAFNLLVATGLAVPQARAADSDPAHMDKHSEKPQAWPAGVIPYDISKLTEAQQATVKHAMQRWLDTGANISFVQRTTETESINFTGKLDAGNNTSLVGFRKGARAEHQHHRLLVAAAGMDASS